MKKIFVPPKDRPSRDRHPVLSKGSEMASTKDLAPAAPTGTANRVLGDSALGGDDLEARRETNAFWVLIIHALLYAAAMLTYFKWDEGVRGPWYPRGFILESVYFFMVLLG